MPRGPKRKVVVAEPVVADNSPLFLVIALVLLLIFTNQAGPLIPVVPPPVSVDGLRVLVIYDEAAESTMPRSQQEILNSPTIREWLDSHCARDATGTPEYRFWPLAVAAAVADDQPIWQQLAKLERKSVPWLIAVDGRKYFSGPLPADEAATMKVLEGFAR